MVKLDDLQLPGDDRFTEYERVESCSHYHILTDAASNRSDQLLLHKARANQRCHSSALERTLNPSRRVAIRCGKIRIQPLDQSCRRPLEGFAFIHG